MGRRKIEGTEQEYIDTLFSKPTLSQVDAAWLLCVSRQRIGQLIESEKVDSVEVSNGRAVETRSLLNYMLKMRNRLYQRAEEMRLPSDVYG